MADMARNGRGDLLPAAQRLIDDAKANLGTAALALDAPSCAPI